MPFIAVLALVLLFIAAMGASWWWRPAEGHWYGGACFTWGVFFLALYLTWPMLQKLGI